MTVCEQLNREWDHIWSKKKASDPNPVIAMEPLQKSWETQTLTQFSGSQVGSIADLTWMHKKVWDWEQATGNEYS